MITGDDTEPGTPDQTGPPVGQWTPELDMLATVVDRLSEMIMATYAASPRKFKSPKLRPTRRPETAVDRARRRAKQEKHRRVTERVRVHKPN